MGNEKAFWAHLLSHLRERVLVPVAGPDLTVVDVGGSQQPLTVHIGRQLSEQYQVALPPGPITTGTAVAAVLREYGRDEGELLYHVITDIIAEADPKPSEGLCDLAAIEAFNLFVATTPDRLLAKAVNKVRFGDWPFAREVSFSPNLSTSEQARLVEPAEPTDTVVLNLFGRASSTPQYAIHEEDRLEWVHALLSDTSTLPGWLLSPLKHNPMLLMGCEIPDWLGRFLLRMSSSDRLSMERSQFFFVNSPTTREPALSDFFDTHCPKTLVQYLDMEPTDFVAELRARWESQNSSKLRVSVDGVTSPARGNSSTITLPTIFISYMREDIEAARRLCDAINELGGEAWLDERRISPGRDWEQDILTEIHQTTKLFVPVVSATTERTEEGYVFKEWREAVERSSLIMGRPFIVPVVIDSDYSGDARQYQQVPPEFRRLHFGHAPGGMPDDVLRNVLINEIRAMRRVDVA